MEEIARFREWVKQVSLAFDGSAYRTMLRNDAYWFSRLGVYLERADNTARILDVKYHVLLPETEQVGGSLDYFQWSTILREVSALTAYHWVYRESVKPWLVADLLILNAQMPRSLASCYENIVRLLDDLGPAIRAAGAVAAAVPHDADPAGEHQHRRPCSRPACTSSSRPSSRTTTSWARQRITEQYSGLRPAPCALTSGGVHPCASVSHTGSSTTSRRRRSR